MGKSFHKYDTNMEAIQDKTDKFNYIKTFKNFQHSNIHQKQS